MIMIKDPFGVRIEFYLGFGKICAGSPGIHHNGRDEGFLILISDDNINEISDGSLIMRCLRRYSGLDAVVEWIKSTWSNLTTPVIEALDFGLFLLTFHSVADCSFVVENGPWFFGQSGLFLAPWAPFVDPATIRITRIPIWIRLYNLPLVMRNEDLIRLLINQVGTFVKFDLEDVTSPRFECVL
ncbi:hypothetical protein SUGI_0795400 [Cryptomeria japonica]|nr:hypothetical protein SUGI_0795400 [Cryptomeria japonica]